MKMLVTLSYLDIFDGPVPPIEDLLEGISSDSIIATLSIINAQLYLDQSFRKQLTIASELLNDENPQIKNAIFGKLAEFKARQSLVDYAFFSIQFCLEFIHHELLHYREGKHMFTIDDRLRFFKAYLVISEKLNETHLSPSEIDLAENLDPFKAQLWPLLLRQFTLENHLNPVVEIPKGIAMFNFFESNELYRQFYVTFLKKVDKPTSWNYIMDLVLLFAQGSQVYEGNNRTNYPCVINDSAGFKSLFSLLTLDINQYALDQNLHRAYIGLKERPLMRINNSIYVLNWNFLASKIYESLVFDFYRLSEINTLPEFEQFLKFKSFVSHKIVEQVLFRRILLSIFSRRGDVVIFDKEKVSGFPDAYVRSGKNIYLFEIKDALFSANILQEPSYVSITEEIDRKFNNERKGIGQLCKHIDFLRQKTFEKKSFEELGIKRRNLVIYPIIVYTDPNFGMPGISQYLVNEFRTKLSQNVISTFNSIKPLTMISLSFFTDNIDLLMMTEHRLKDIVNSYQSAITNRSSSKPKPNPVENSVLKNETIEQYFGMKNRKKILPQYRNYVERIVKALKLTDNLPPQ